MKNFTLEKGNTGLLVVDVQEKLFPLVDQQAPFLYSLQKVIRGCQILGVPIYVTEQYPEGLGETLGELKRVLGPAQVYFSKRSFSCLGNPEIKEILSDKIQWIVVGLESHVCVLQTAKDLLKAGKEVVTLNDAISSRSIYDYSTAIAEMRDIGVRISSVETVLFELVATSSASSFKEISQLIKE